MGKLWKQWETLFSWAPKSLQMVTAAMKLKGACSLEESYHKPRQHNKKQRHYFAKKDPSSQSQGFFSSNVWMWDLKQRKLSTKELTLLNCGAGEDSWESLGLQNQTSQSWRKSVWNTHCKNWCWSWSSNTLAMWHEELTQWKRPWCWERLKAGTEGDDSEWDGWMALLTLGTWIWASSGSWWWTGNSGVLQSWGCKESDTTEWLNWTGYGHGIQID